MRQRMQEVDQDTDRTVSELRQQIQSMKEYRSFSLNSHHLTCCTSVRSDLLVHELQDTEVDDTIRMLRDDLRRSQEACLKLEMELARAHDSSLQRYSETASQFERVGMQQQQQMLAVAERQAGALARVRDMQASFANVQRMHASAITELQAAREAYKLAEQQQFAAVQSDGEATAFDDEAQLQQASSEHSGSVGYLSPRHSAPQHHHYYQQSEQQSLAGYAHEEALDDQQAARRLSDLDGERESVRQMALGELRALRQAHDSAVEEKYRRPSSRVVFFSPVWSSLYPSSLLFCFLCCHA